VDIERGGDMKLYAVALACLCSLALVGSMLALHAWVGPLLVALHR
jgi:hypothetical protein